MQIAKQQKNCTTAKKMHNSKNERRNHTTTWHNCENKGTTVKTKAQLQKIFLLFTLHCLLRLLDSAHSSAIPRSPPRYNTPRVLLTTSNGHHPSCYHETSSRTTARQKHEHGRLPWLSLFAHNFSMVLRWTADATAELRRRIDRGQINPNFEDAPYLGDVVSGEHFPEYEALPPTGRQTAIVRFRRLFRRIRLERELQGQRRLAAEGGEEEGKFLVM
jgi:hypothetical protein